MQTYTEGAAFEHQNSLFRQDNCPAGCSERVRYEIYVKDFILHAASKGKMRKYEENAKRKYENKSIYQMFAIQ